MQGFVNHFAFTNCALKYISVKGFENVLQIFLRLKRLLTPIPQVFVNRHLCSNLEFIGLSRLEWNSELAMFKLKTLACTDASPRTPEGKQMDKSH